MGLKNSISYFITEKCWTIGFVEDSIEDILSGKKPSIKWLKSSYKKGWFADPFILDVNNDEILVLVEEFLYSENKGRISLLTIDRKSYKLLAIRPLLSLNSHLSFPAIMRQENKVYVYPENGLNNTLDLYIYLDAGSQKLIYESNVMKAPLADAVITDLFRQRLMFATELPIQNKNVLNVYKPDGAQYKKVNSITLSSNVARNAGDWFEFDGTVYRPAQDCNQIYGGAVIIQRVEQTDEYTFSFKDVARIESDNKFYKLGCHTLNFYKGIAVVDAHGYRRARLKKSYDLIRGIQ